MKTWDDFSALARKTAARVLGHRFQADGGWEGWSGACWEVYASVSRQVSPDDVTFPGYFRTALKRQLFRSSGQELECWRRRQEAKTGRKVKRPNRMVELDAPIGAEGATLADMVCVDRTVHNPADAPNLSREVIRETLATFTPEQRDIFKHVLLGGPITARLRSLSRRQILGRADELTNVLRARFGMPPLPKRTRKEACTAGTEAALVIYLSKANLAASITALFTTYLSSQGRGAAADALNLAGVPTPVMGRKWTAGMVQRGISNESFRALVSPELVQQVDHARWARNPAMVAV